MLLWRNYYDGSGLCGLFSFSTRLSLVGSKLVYIALLFFLKNGINKFWTTRVRKKIKDFWWFPALRFNEIFAPEWNLKCSVTWLVSFLSSNSWGNNDSKTWEFDQQIWVPCWLKLRFMTEALNLSANLKWGLRTRAWRYAVYCECSVENPQW